MTGTSVKFVGRSEVGGITQTSINPKVRIGRGFVVKAFIWCLVG